MVPAINVPKKVAELPYIVEIIAITSEIIIPRQKTMIESHSNTLHTKFKSNLFMNSIMIFSFILCLLIVILCKYIHLFSIVQISLLISVSTSSKIVLLDLISFFVGDVADILCVLCL